MNLQNGYKVIYEKAADGERTFYASKSGVFADVEVITKVEIGKYKLIYEKDGRCYGSESGIPAKDDYCFEAFDVVLKEAVAEHADKDTFDDPLDTKSGEESTEGTESDPTFDLPTFEEGQEE